MRAAHDLGVRDGHLDNRLRVLRADLLKEGQLQTGVSADEFGLDHVEPAGRAAAARPERPLALGGDVRFR